MCIVARFCIEIWNPKTFSWRSIIPSRSVILVSRRCLRALKIMLWLFKEPHITCPQRYAKTSHIPINQIYGHLVAFSTSSALWSTLSTLRTCWDWFSRLSKTSKSQFLTHIVMDSKIWSTRYLQRMKMPDQKLLRLFKARSSKSICRDLYQVRERSTSIPIRLQRNNLSNLLEPWKTPNWSNKISIHSINVIAFACRKKQSVKQNLRPWRWQQLRTLRITQKQSRWCNSSSMEHNAHLPQVPFKEVPLTLPSQRSRVSSLVAMPSCLRSLVLWTHRIYMFLRPILDLRQVGFSWTQ